MLDQDMRQRRRARDSDSPVESLQQSGTTTVSAKADGKEPAPLELRATTFQHNGRMWLAFIPCLIVLLAFGGKIVSGVLVVGFLLAYVLDALGQREGTLTAVWFTVIGIEICLIYLASFLVWKSFLNVLLIYSFGAYTLLTGLWATMQFHWLVREYPMTVILFERIMVAAFPLQCFGIMAWGLVGMLGATAAPFYLAVVGAILLETFALPLPSSFRLAIVDPKQSTVPLSVRTYDVDQGYILGGFEVGLQLLFFLYSPALVYLILNFHVILDEPIRVTDIALLLGLPLLMIYRLSKKGILWFASITEDQLTYVQNVCVAVIAILAVVFFEARVIFQSFRGFIALPFPINVIVVTAGLLVSVGVLLYGIVAHSKTFVGLIVSLVFGGIGCGLLCYAFKLPLMYILTIEGATLFFIAFLFQRNFWQYLNFAMCATIAMITIFNSHLGFLKFSFESLHWEFSSFAVALQASIILALVIPGFMLTPMMSTSFVSVTVNLLLIAYGVLLAVLEELLYGQKEDMYPAYWVMFTSALGLYLTSSLTSTKRLASWASVLLTTIFIAKLSVLVTSSPMSILNTALYIAPILYLIHIEQIPLMTPRKAFVYLVFMGVSSYLWSDLLPAKLIHLILRTTSADAVVPAAWLITWSISALPLAFRFFPEVAFLRRFIGFVLVTAVFLFVLQPSMDLPLVVDSLRASWEEGPRKAIEQGYQHASIWTPWVLFALLIVNGINWLRPTTSAEWLAININPTFGQALGQLFTSWVYFISAILIALYSWGSLFPRVAYLGWYVFGMYAMAALMVSMILLTAERKDPVSGDAALSIYQGFMILLPVIAYMQYTTITGLGPKLDLEKHQDASLGLLGTYCVINLILALYFKAKLDNLASIVAPSSGTRPDRAVLRDKALLRAVPLTSQQALPYPGWMATVGNSATTIGFVLAMAIATVFYHGPVLAPFVLSPVFLLLSRGPNAITRALSGSNRYGPVFLALCSCLIFRAILHITNEAIELNSSFDGLSVFWVVSQSILVFLTLPATFAFVSFSLSPIAAAAAPSTMMTSVWWVGPIALLAVVFGDALELKLAAGVAFVGMVVREIFTRRKQQASLRML